MNNVKKSIEQTGRSMIEMLGVLAIIAVLSVVGMAGYSKAMERYRINETINQVVTIIHNTRDLFRAQKDYSSLSSIRCNISNSSCTNRGLVEKARIFPDSIKNKGYKNIFGGEIEFISEGRLIEGDKKAVALFFHNIPSEACMKLLTQDWRSAQGFIGISARGSVAKGAYVELEGSCASYYSQGVGLFCATDFPITLRQATTVCDREDDGHLIIWKFY